MGPSSQENFLETKQFLVFLTSVFSEANSITVAGAAATVVVVDIVMVCKKYGMCIKRYVVV